MKIAFFTESLLPLVDGVSLTLAQLFRSLEAAGIDFVIYAPFAAPPEIPWSRRVHVVRSLSFPLYPDYKVSFPGGPRLAASLDEYAPDIVHVVSPTPMAFWAQGYARERGIPVVGTFHTHFVSYFTYYHMGVLEPLGWSLLRRFYGRCNATYAPSESIASELREHDIPDVRLWARGIDTRRFSPAWRDESLRAAVGADDDTPLLLLVSRLVKEKDLADLVAMEAVLNERGVRHRLALVGDGPMRAELERLLPDAHFAGHRSGAELARWYASADVFIFPSTTETFANVVQEAMASGLPAVVVDRGGPPGVIEDGRSGFVARAHDAVHMAEFVERLLRDCELRAAMGRAGRDRALERSWDSVNAVLLRDYHTLAAGRTAPEQRPA